MLAEGGAAFLACNRGTDFDLSVGSGLLGLIFRYDAGVGLIFSYDAGLLGLILGYDAGHDALHRLWQPFPIWHVSRRTLGVEYAKYVVPENRDVPIAAQIVPIRAMGHAPILRYEAILIVAVVLKPQ